MGHCVRTDGPGDTTFVASTTATTLHFYSGWGEREARWFYLEVNATSRPRVTSEGNE
jgi:hypothetical protein